MEKEERKFLRDVAKQEQARDERKRSLESKKKEKENFVKRYFPTSFNSPGGTLKLVPTDVTSAGNRGVEKMKDCTSRNFSAVKFKFTNNILNIAHSYA